MSTLRPRSFITVPLTARGCVLGGVLLLQSEPGRRFDESDLALAELIAGRAALALDNAMLFEQQHEVATTLQHALLPGRLPQTQEVTATARYRPGTATLDVGGDWYDVITLPGRRVGIVLGDVVGRGVAAAATMGQLRSAVAAIAPYAAGPAEVLQRLDRFAATVPGAELATVAYADFHPGTGCLRYACAGHPPPLLLTDQGGARFLAGGRGVPLVTGSGLPWQQEEIVLDREATLVCYTDGLLERRGTDIDTRMRDLVAVAAQLSGRPLTQLGDGLLERMVGPSAPGDDVAVLCLDLRRGSTRRFHRILPAERDRLAPLRAALRAWAAEAGVDRLGIGDLLLATGEACANVVEHAYLDGRTGAEVEVGAEIDADGSLVARVSDTGRWRDQPHGIDHRGHGLALIRAVMADVEVDAHECGTTVTMRTPAATARPGSTAASAGT
jgi:serine phosphatase RsbU (regulator of sigma subunit)/anti-sigma regulatory factor (Ser/Thr protein kinase)